MNYVCLIGISLVALDWFVRIIKYAQTGDGKYKHEHFWWMK